MVQTVRNDTISVGATAVEIMGQTNYARPRRFFYVRNNSTGGQVITLVFGDLQTITANQGIVLVPTAAYYEVISFGDAEEVWQSRIWAIASAAGGSISVVERS